MDKKIAKNYLYSVSYRILLTLVPLITSPYLSRTLKPEGIGLASYTGSIAALFVLFADLGFGTYGQREVAYCQDDLHGRSVVFFEIEILRFITTALAVSGFLIISIHYEQYTVLLLPQSMSILSGLFDISWYYHGLENFRITVLRGTFLRIISVFVIFIFIKQPEDLLLFIVILSASGLFSNLFFFISIQKYVKRVRLSELRPARHLKGAVEFFIPLIAVEIYSHLDKIMLGYLTPTNTESGYYEQARKITTILVSLIISINNVMLPRISKLYAKNDSSTILQFYRKTFKVLLMIMLPVCAGLCLVSNNFVLWFFGPDFSKVSVLLMLSSILILFMCIGNFVGMQYLSPTGQQNKMTMAYITAAVSNIVMNALLIPRFASVGAMVASIFAEIISCGIQFYLLMKSDFRFNMFEGIWKYIVAIIGMTAGLLVLRVKIPLTGIIMTLVEVFLGACIYIVLLLILKEENAKLIWTRIIRNQS